MSKLTCFIEEKNVPVCTFKTSPFVPAPRAHMFQHVCAWCRYTRGRFERTHGDVLSGHTEFRSVSHTNTHTLTHNTHNTPHHNTTQHITTTTPHGEERDRDRQRQRKKTGTGRGEKTEEKRKDKRREDKRKTRKDKRTEKIRFQCGGAWPLLVGVVIFWLVPFAHET